jgi:hypothetical protein
MLTPEPQFERICTMLVEVERRFYSTHGVYNG